MRSVNCLLCFTLEGGGWRVEPGGWRVEGGGRPLRMQFADPARAGGGTFQAELLSYQVRYHLEMSFFEVYNEKIHDLLVGRGDGRQGKQAVS